MQKVRTAIRADATIGLKPLLPSYKNVLCKVDCRIICDDGTIWDLARDRHTKSFKYVCVQDAMIPQTRKPKK